MAVQLLIAVSMLTIISIFHVTLLFTLLFWISQWARRRNTELPIVTAVALVLLAVEVVSLAHLLEVSAYALMYDAGGAIGVFRDAFAFSAANYVTLSSDVSVRPGWRIVVAMQAANGVMLMGISTAFFVSVVGHIFTLREKRMNGDPEPAP